MRGNIGRNVIHHVQKNVWMVSVTLLMERVLVVLKDTMDQLAVNVLSGVIRRFRVTTRLLTILSALP